MSKRNARREGGASAIRAKLRKQLSLTATTCPICGQPLDWSIKWDRDNPSPYYVELDEIVPVSLWLPELQTFAATTADNIQAVHRICNQRKGAKTGFTVQNTMEKKTTVRKAVSASQAW